jgi:hypothetical protein
VFAIYVYPALQLTIHERRYTRRRQPGMSPGLQAVRKKLRYGVHFVDIFSQADTFGLGYDSNDPNTAKGREFHPTCFYT